MSTVWSFNVLVLVSVRVKSVPVSSKANILGTGGEYSYLAQVIMVNKNKTKVMRTN